MEQNKISKMAIFGALILGAVIWSFSERKPAKTPENGLKTDTMLVYVERYNDNVDWDAFIKALIWVESKGDSNAVGSSDDVGVLQVTPVLVQECNRILGNTYYKLEDRRDSLKSVEMFNVICTSP